MAQKEYLNNAGLEHYDEKIKEYIGDNTNYDIVALKEVSPAESTHSIGEYIAYNHIIYQVIDDISIGDTLVVNTNIEQAVLPEGTVIYSDDEQGGTGFLSYNDLSDKPQIAGTILQGDKSLADLGIASANDVATALAGKVDILSVGSASGVAELDANGKVPSSQLPSYVDDVLEYASQSAFPSEGEQGKIYVAIDTNKSYRWSGTQYVEISESLALGETSSTAYAGNKGKANADAITAMKNGSSIDSFGDVETALTGKQATLTIENGYLMI